LKYSVSLLEEAEDDIFEIYRYIASHGSPGNAKTIYENLRKRINSLDQQPARGHVPPELERVDVMDFLEIHYKPYRIIYQIIKMEFSRG